MSDRLKQLGEYLALALVSNAVYGLILYFVFTWLSGYSLMHAYIGNLALIVSILAIDEYYQRYLQSEKFITQLKKQKDAEKIFQTIQRGLNSVGSFKADIYLFYIFILLFSQIINFYPSMVDEKIGNFIRTNDYSILVLVAFDTLIGQFTKDRERMRSATEKLRKSLTEGQD